MEDDGGINKFPVGYRFDPTDEELVSFYLMNKIYGQPLPTSFIQEYDVFKTEPWKLPTSGYAIEERKYFFHMSGCGIDRKVAGFGEWRTVEEKEIVLPNNKEFIGKRNTLVFLDMRTHVAIKTLWIMQQFLLSSAVDPTKVSAWGVYCIFKEK